MCSKSIGWIRILIMMLVIFCFPVTVSAKSVKTKYIAHRGYTGVYPENTVEAFKGAMQAGFDGIELDVYETKSGDLLVFHDETLDRMCGVSKSIFDLTMHNKKKYPLVSGSNIDRYEAGSLFIPSLDKVIRHMSRINGEMFIHLKCSLRMTQTGIKKIMQTLKKYHVADRCIIFCVNIPILQKFQKKGYKVGYSHSSLSKNEAEANMRLAIEQKMDCYIEVNPQYMTKDIVKTCRKNGLISGAYKVRTKKEANRLKKMGADFMFNYDHLLK